MKAKPTPDATRHRMLEGVLLRLARRPDASEFVLRGGVLLRHWFRPVPRPAEDLDLVATFPANVEEAVRRLLPVFADTAPDGVTFEADRVRGEGIWLDSGNPGVRVFASGAANGVEDEFHVDVTFGPYPRPAPVQIALPTECGETVRVWACRPEAVAGHKVQALWHRGLTGWQPKDLNDLRMLLARVPMDAGELRASVLAYLSDVGATAVDARALFGPESWWGTKMASARWLDFVAESRAGGVPGVPGELTDVAAEIGRRLSSVLEGLP
jgi:hypothetical protein